MDDEVVFADDSPDLVVFADAPQPTGSDAATAAPASHGHWIVLVVDDEVGVHDVTRLALADLSFEGRALQLVSAYSAEEATRALTRHPDTAVILLDVVMESERAGLDFVHQVRTVMGNQLVRIILRTGQPGHAPERRVIVEYDINDYKQKSDLTAQRLFTSLIGALRSYRDLRYISDFNRALGRFVPTQLTQILGKQSIVDVSLGDHIERDMGVVFCDLRSFTTMSERLAPRATFTFLNRYLAAIGPVARAHNGYIDKYVGDGILAIFPDGADDALAAALAMHGTVDAFNIDLVDLGEAPVAIGVGVHVGPLVLGIIGEAERMEGTVIADCVNVACRIEALCKEHGVRIVTTRECLDATGDPARYITRPLGSLAVRGKSDPVDAHELLGMIPTAT